MISQVAYKNVPEKRNSSDRVNLDRAINILNSTLAEDQIKVDLDSRLTMGRSTLSEGTIPRVILEPNNKDEIQLIMQIANDHGCKVHPISSGKNWGYSDACALEHGVFLIDLKRLNKIIEVNRELGYAVIEPGVTQGQLYEYLKKNDVQFWMDATGAGPDTSIIGNTMERGFGHSPLGDRYANTCGYEIILPTGDLINTGFDQYKNSKVGNVFKWGLGPSIDGLFTQSNLGIVTKMTFWLLPKPEDFKVCFFMLDKEESIQGFIDAARPLRMDGTLKSVIHIGNDLRVVSMSQSFPFGEVDGSSALNRDKRKELIQNHGVGWWSGTAGFYGSKSQVKADIKKFKKAVKHIKDAKVVVINDSKIKLAENISAILNRYSYGESFLNLIKKVRLAFELLKGNSPKTCVQGGLWRVRNPKIVEDVKSSNPLDYQAGFYWISPVLPMTGKDVREFNQLVEPIFNKYGFDMQQTISMTTERALSSVLTISFDKKNDVEPKKAKVCHDEVVSLIMKKGYQLYRAGNHTMGLIHDKSEAQNKFFQKIKMAIDPNDVLSPGKYIQKSMY